MSVAPHAGVVDFGTFTPPTASKDGIQGEVPQPLIGQENYVLTGNGWSSLGALGALTYQGTWDASTNTPTLVSSVGVQGYYYVVSVAGNTDLNGITTWDVGDWVIFNGSVWQKLEGGAVGTFTNVITPQVTARTDNLTLSAISTGAVKFNTLGGLQAQVTDTSGVDSYVNLSGGVGSATVAAGSASGNIDLRLDSRASGSVRFRTAGSLEQLRVSHTASSVNYVQITGAATGGFVAISAQGSDSNPGIYYTTKGFGSHRFTTNTGGGSEQFRIITNSASTVNFLQVNGSATTLAPQFSAQGTDTNISMAFQPKGTGAIDLAAGSSGVNISNGGTVTAITRTASGTGYTSFPTVAVSAPTTAGGVQATILMPYMFVTGGTVASGGTGYTVGDTLTMSGGTPQTVAGTLTVSSVSGGVITGLSGGNFANYSVLPTNPISMTGGTGTGASINVTYGVSSTGFAVNNAGSGYIEQPTVTFSGGGGGSGASAYAVVGGVTTIRGLGSSSPGNIANSILFNTPSGTAFSIVDRAAVAVNYASAIGNVTTQPAIIRGLGSDTNVGLNLGSQGTGTITFSTSTTSSNVQFVVNHIASSVNYLQATGSATGNATGPILSAQGSDTNIPIQIQGKGTGSVAVLTPTTLGGTTGNTAELFAAKGFNSNSIWLRASQYRNATGTDWQTASLRLGQRIDTTDMSYIEFNPSGFPQGIAIQTANNQPINFNTSGAQFRVGVSASSVNYVQAAGGATTKTPIISAQGSDTNVSLGIQSKGTGAIDLAAGSSGVNISNGGTVTAVTRVTSGGNYTSFPTVAVSAPTTAGGVQAVLAITMAAQSGTAVTPANGGTGYTLNDVLTVVGGTGTAAQFTVTGVSAGVVTQVTRSNSVFGIYTVLPTSPAATTGGTGTGCTLNMLYEVLPPTITTAGSGYIEQPTVTFSGGGGSGASAYATVGSATTVKTLGNTLSFYTPSGEGFRVQDAGTTSSAYWTAFGTSTTPVLRAISGVSGSVGTASAVPLQFITNTSTEQCRIAHTASAVNYVQVTGAATGSGPIISTQGSDTNATLTLRSKGTFAVTMQSSAGANIFEAIPTASSVNYLRVAPSIASSAPTLSAQGTDTNIDLALTPKGTGRVKFGTLTATADAPITGYIEIVDSGGTIRKLAVIT